MGDGGDPQVIEVALTVVGGVGYQWVGPRPPYLETRGAKGWGKGSTESGWDGRLPL